MSHFFIVSNFSKLYHHSQHTIVNAISKGFTAALISVPLSSEMILSNAAHISTQLFAGLRTERLSSSQGDGVRTWGLWKVMRVEPSRMGSVRSQPLHVRRRSCSLPPRRESTPEPDPAGPSSLTSSLRDCRK